jgi:CheY-like chemotaxis protein
MTILVVEDNTFVRMQLVSILRDAGYAVIEASDGEQAKGLLNDAVRLAIVDVLMEPVGGLGFIRHLKTEGYEHLPVILVTGDQKPDLLQQTQKLGVESVLFKPVQRDRLVTMVERILARYNKALDV